MSVDMDRLKSAFDDAVDAALPDIDYEALYTCLVVSQNPDGTLDLQPISSKLPSQKNIPIRGPFPNVKMTVGPNAQVLMGWENHDPSVPYAALWLPGAPGDLETLAIVVATQLQLGSSNAVDAVVKGTTYRAAEDAWFSSLSVAIATAASALNGAATPPTLPNIVVACTAAGAALQTVASALQTFESTAASYLSQIVQTA